MLETTANSLLPSEQLRDQIRANITPGLAWAATQLSEVHVESSDYFSVVDGRYGYGEIKAKEITVSQPFNARDGYYGYGAEFTTPQEDDEFNKFTTDPENYGDNIPTSAVPVNETANEEEYANA